MTIVDPSVRSIGAKQIPPQPESRPVVLLVEDESSYVEALVVGLEREGFDLVVAQDGKIGRASCRERV